MSKRALIISLLSLLMLANACIREDLPTINSVPEGTPVTLTIGFGASTPIEVNVGTKAESSKSDESRVHDLYVLIFDKNGNRHYGRYFSYEQRWYDIDGLNQTSNEREGWYVENKTQDKVVPAVSKTVGAVKIATSAIDNCTLVLLANVSNTLISLDEQDPLDVLNDLNLTLGQLRSLPVRLEQNVTNRNDLFLMAGEKTVADLRAMIWHDDTPDSGSAYSMVDANPDYQVTLKPIDAKVKFRVKGGANVSDLVFNKWTAFNIPSSCYLLPAAGTPYAFPEGDGHTYFDTTPTYFETDEIDESNNVWKTFTFYMMESCLSPFKLIAEPYDDADDVVIAARNPYYLRERKDRDAWKYAPQKAPYVTFGVSMSLNAAAIGELDNWDAGTNPEPDGATFNASYTVHLGDFGSSANSTPNDYNTRRGHFYTYDITLNNASSLYAEVKSDIEYQSGQEGSLVLFSEGVVNCDAHYEYREIAFNYVGNLDLENPVYSWSVKTPFTSAGKPSRWDPSQGGYVVDPAEKIDYLWVKFAINKLDNTGKYSRNRVAYPGDGAYVNDWYPGQLKSGTSDVRTFKFDGTDHDHPQLMDINQLINYIYYQHKQIKKVPREDIFDSDNVIRVTAFVDEYYYERDPFTGAVNPDLWRAFVNADPREMNILANVRSSSDGRSHVIDASHSIVQKSIQTMYNVSYPGLASIWGTEHKDEMRNRGEDDGRSVNKSWSWWRDGAAAPTGNIKDEENGRVNTASIWGISNGPEWNTFLNYEVDNDTPELQSNYQHMAYSCLSRNRDNNGNGVIDPEELRWYTAAINQLVGMWVGNESLSPSARLYQPVDATSSDPLEWRAHVVSSTCTNGISDPRVIRAEEGATKSFYDQWNWAFPPGSDIEFRDRIASVRCLRNAGTYSEGGRDTDISYAPYDQMVDPYYEVAAGTDDTGKAKPNDDGTYTIRFSRLDPKSIRAYTSEELPYHDEYSLHNCVYLELNLQEKTNTVVNDGSLNKTEQNLNNDVTGKGYNPYCPAGYRIPNMTELLVMTGLIPLDYWNGNHKFPCRTFFSHGILGDNQKETEKTKIGWQYDRQANRVNMAENSATMTSIRCVRDKDMTGTINGKMFLTSNIILPNDATMLHFNFISTAVAFTTGKLWLSYPDKNGTVREKQLDLETAPDGMEYKTEQPFSVDPLTIEGGPLEMPVQMMLRLELTNAQGVTETVTYPFTLTGIGIDLDFSLEEGYEASSGGFPIAVNAKALGVDTKIIELAVQWKKLGSTDAWEEIPVNAAEGLAEYSGTAYFALPSDNMPGTYVFRLVGKSSKGASGESGQQTMQFLQINKRWNVEDPDNRWVTAGDIVNPWPVQKIGALNFANGDFIETLMDLNDCTYRPLNPDPSAVDTDNDIGMDEILAFGLYPRIGNPDAAKKKGDPSVLHFYYPAAQYEGAILHTYLNSQMVYGNNAWRGGNVGELNSTDPLTIRMDKNGVCWNESYLTKSQLGNDNNAWAVLSQMTSAHTLYIGSVEGFHRSRALYTYVRIVRKDLGNVQDSENGGFDGDPLDGGDL